MEISAPTLILMRQPFELQRLLQLSKSALHGTQVSFFPHNVDIQGDIEMAPIFFN